MATTPNLLLIKKAVNFQAVHGVNTYASEVGSVGTPTVVFLTGPGMLLEIHTADLLEGLVMVYSLGQLNLTKPGRQRQRSPRAPAGAARRQPQRGELREPSPGRASPARAEPALPAGLGAAGCSQGY